MPHNKAFSALIKGPNKENFWTPMYRGSTATAQKYLNSVSNASEVSIYRGGKFIKTIRKVI